MKLIDMALKFLRDITGKNRKDSTNAQLGYFLAFIAGAINAGGFLAIGQYTSHMTGIVSAMADNLILGSYGLVLTGSIALLAFILGAALTAILINYARRHNLHSEFALPLLIEAGLLLFFGALGTQISSLNSHLIAIIIVLLSFIMGLQNAVITKLSKAVIRTTHITGIVTDIGIELGKFFYHNSKDKNHLPTVRADGRRLKILTILVFSFFFGGILGAYSFKAIGFYTTLPLALLLMMLAILPVWDDLARKFSRTDAD